MATEAKAKDSDTEGAVKPKGSKKMLIIILAAVVLLAVIGGGAAYFLMKHDGGDEGEEDEVATEKDKKKAGKEVMPVYVAMDAFTVNLAPENGEQYLQLILSLEVSDLKTGDKLKAYTPKLRNQVMLLLSGKKASELLPREGKEKLAAEILELTNEVIEPGSKGAKDAPIKEVLFTSFIIQ